MSVNIKRNEREIKSKNDDENVGMPQVLFYSEFNKMGQSEWAHKADFEVRLFIGNGDAFIIDTFDGPLKPEYESIEHYSQDVEFGYLTIEYTKDR